MSCNGVTVQSSSCACDLKKKSVLHIRLQLSLAWIPHPGLLLVAFKKQPLLPAVLLPVECLATADAVQKNNTTHTAHQWHTAAAHSTSSLCICSPGMAGRGQEVQLQGGIPSGGSASNHISVRLKEVDVGKRLLLWNFLALNYSCSFYRYESFVTILSLCLWGSWLT